MIFTKMEPNVLKKKLSNYGYLNATNSLKPRLAVHVAFLRKHIESRAKALSDRISSTQVLQWLTRPHSFLSSSDCKESELYC